MAVIPAERRTLGFPPNLLLLGLVGQAPTSLYPDGRELVATYYIRELEIDVWRIPNGSPTGYVLDVEGEEIGTYTGMPSYDTVSSVLNQLILQDAARRTTGSEPADP